MREGGQRADAAGRRYRSRLAVTLTLYPRSYAFANSVPACWSCNHLKGEFPRAFFESELPSLARAVVAKFERDPA